MLLQGRSAECRRLDGLLELARDGQSSVLVLRGESGVGKTALLDYAAERAWDCRVVRVAGIEGEAEFAFAALLQLLGGEVSAEAGKLAGPQREALERAFGLARGPAPEAFLVGLAALSLLSQAAEDRPVVCLIDDAQWLDRDSLLVLSFIARRLAAEPIVMLFAVREPATVPEVDTLPEFTITGLGVSDARLLLAAAVPGAFDVQVRERIIAESRGNPLALLELSRGMMPAELAGGFAPPDAWGPPDTWGLSNRIEQSFLRRVQALAFEARRVLLIAAVESVGDWDVIARAAQQWQLTLGDLAPAEDAGLVRLGPKVSFRHPLARSAAYRAATPHQRRLAHEVVAAATDPRTDPDRRAWHLAQAAAEPTEVVAAELERSAVRARARGGMAAAAAFLERACQLSPDPVHRGERALAAAKAKFDAGALEAAETLLDDAAACPIGELDRARLERLRAQMAFARTSGKDTPAQLSAAAQRLEPLDPPLARETHLEALLAAIRSRRFTRTEAVIEAAQAATRDLSYEPTRAIDLLLESMVVRLTRGYEPSLPLIARALAAFRAEGFRRENLAWSFLACQLAWDSWDEEAWEAISNNVARKARENGFLTDLTLALRQSATHQLFLGNFEVAEQLMQEAIAVSTSIRNVPLVDPNVLLAAWRGDRQRTNTMIAAAIEAGTARGEGFTVEVAEWLAAVLHNGLGEYAAAAEAAQRAYDPRGLGFTAFVLPELIEAAVRSGDRTRAEAAFAQLEERSRASTTAWARGIEAASHALLSEGGEAEYLHREAIDQLGRSRFVALHARAQLNYGEWLRRENRRNDARTQLNVALHAFETMGALGFADRARRELLATGQPVQQRQADTLTQLTTQEAQIARMAAERQTNHEIAAQLYLSHRTVEYHLHKVFTKLGVSSRKELADALRSSRGPSRTGGEAV